MIDSQHFDQAMDMIHENSVSAISLIQSSFHKQTSLMYMLSTVFDPRYVFLIYAPLFFTFNQTIGRKIMWTVVLAEWANQILKWLLHGERPYWWIHETSIYNNTELPPVRQFTITCETSPGSPSGHAMITAAVWYVIVANLLKNHASISQFSNFTVTKSVMWLLYTTLVFSVSMSRVYLAAHFPHQCLLGGVIGLIVGYLVENLNLENVSRRKYVAGTMFLFGTAMLTLVALQAMGVDPAWSVNRAIKWCAKREYVHIDTTPLFSLMRYAGFFLGVGIASTLTLTQQLQSVEFTLPMKAIVAIVSVNICRYSQLLSVQSDNIYMVYTFIFSLHAALPVLFMTLVPYAVSKAFTNKSKMQ